jgi:hypothetical protein
MLKFELLLCSCNLTAKTQLHLLFIYIPSAPCSLEPFRFLNDCRFKRDELLLLASSKCRCG